MPDPTLLICPGATKAGTSWLYRYLHDHSACQLRAVKELHYFDTFDGAEQGKKTAVLRNQVTNYQADRATAEASNIGWKVRNMDRRIADTQGLINALEADRSGDKAYVKYLIQGTKDKQLVADVCPSYAILEPSILERIAVLPLQVKVLYLVRDPLERLWSHVRMHAKRFLRDGQEVVKKSTNVLSRILNQGHESHITERGDYRATIQAFQAAFPADALQVRYSENLSNVDEQREICAFLNIPFEDPQQADRGHVGVAIPFPENRRAATMKFLANQYRFIAKNFGPVPANWAKNMEALG